MARDEQDRSPISPECLARPQISLAGEVNEQALKTFLDGLAEAEKGEGDIVVEITTPGGDAELARRLVLEVERARKRIGPKRRLLFLGKTQVYSAGVTLMSAFPRADRYLTRDAVLLIHCRQLDKSIELSGPIRASLPQLEAVKRQLEIGVELETGNFERLIEGSDVGMDELLDKALCNWYLRAEEALERGLVAQLV